MLTEPEHVDLSNSWFKGTRTWIILALIWSAFAVLILVPGNVVITSHWGDALHLVDILERMSQGQKPHLDFVTPIGEWAFSPISTLMGWGLEAGLAYLWAQVLLAGLLSIATLVVSLDRMQPALALLFSLLVLVTTLALSHGRPELSLSLNVHYNRWAWAISFLALVIVVLPANRGALRDGILLGFAFSALALIKVTYFVAFLPVAILTLVLTRRSTLLLFVAATGFVVLMLLTLIWGIDYWIAYFQDVAYVAQAGGRPNAGHGVLHFLTDTRMFAPIILVALAVAVMLRCRRHKSAAIFVLVFGAGAFVSDQNAGFDPFFLGFLALLALVWARNLDGNSRLGIFLIGIGLGMTFAPNLFNLASSPVRAALADRSWFVPLVTGGERHQDILLERTAATSRGEQYFAIEGQKNDASSSRVVATFLGETLPDCRSQLSPAYFASISNELAALELAQGQPIFVADYLSPLWLFGDHPPLVGAAPWSYGGLFGIENAAYVLLPKCPNRIWVNRSMLKPLETLQLAEVIRTSQFRLFSIGNASQ